MLNTLQIGLEWFPEQGGGLDRVFYDCSRHLPQANIQFHGLVAGSTVVAQQTNGQITAFASPADPLLQRWSSLRNATRHILQTEDISLVVSHFALHTFPILNQLKDLPLVIHFQGPWALESRLEGSNPISTRFKWIIEWATYRRGSQFIVLSSAFKAILHQTYHVPLERIHIVPPGVDLNQFQTTTIDRTTARNKLGWPQDRPILLCVRRLAKRMGLENLITAIQTVRRTHPDVLLLIAGKGTLQPTLHRQIEDLNLTNHVKLLGFIADADLALAYRAATLSVVPTVALEGFGLIVIESLANGTPVMATPISSLPEILQPLSPDLLFEGISPAQISQGLNQVLSGQRRLPDENTCKTYVENHYTWPVVSDRIRKVYEMALASP